MAATSGLGGMSGAILAALGAATVAGTITAAIVTAGAQHTLDQQDCASPGDNLASQEAPTSSGGSGAGGTIDGIPPEYMELYSSAASEYGLDVAILAAVGYIETKHGAAMDTSSAGAQGPMQFMPETWAAFGYDANGDGTADVWDPADAIPSAAKYLRDSGAPEDYHGALLAYNHAGWYVQDVLAKADEYRASMGGGGGGEFALVGAAFPSAGDAAAGFGALFRSAASPLGVRPAYATDGSEAVPDPKGEGIGEAVMPIPGADRGSYTDGWGTIEGTEFRASEGSQVNSPVGGEVVRHNGSWGSVMVEADYAVGTVREGDLVFVSGLNGKDVRVGDRVSAGQSLGSAGTGGLHLGLYDPTGQRAESGSGAMNPFPMMNWLAENGGEASGVTATAPACENSDGAGGSAAPDGGGGGGTTSGSGSEVVAEAEKYLGVPYLLGGPEVCVPGETMDCTCLTTTVYGEFGHSLPDMPQGTLEYGEPVDEPAPGDLIVFPDPGDGTGGHVGIAAGGGEMIHACLPCGEVTYGPISGAGTPNGYRRLVG
jgi:murein DD-endopeptidase MepM/ murein hydrolase activator NlpD